MPDLFLAAPLRRVVVAAAPVSPAVVLAAQPAAVLQPQLVAAVDAASARKIAVRFDRKIDPDVIRILDGRLADRIGGLRPRPGNGVRREEIGLPVAPFGELTDALVYEGATDGKRYALSRYRLATYDAGGVRRYAIRLEPVTAEIWTLRVELEPYRAPPLAGDASLQPLPDELLLRFVYNVALAGGGGTRKEIPFDNVERKPDGSAVATLTFASIAARDQARAAIASIAGGAGILVTRTVRVGVPMPPDPRVLQRFVLYRPVTRGIDQNADPDPLFIDPASRHPLFDGLTNAGQEPGLALRQVRWGDTFASYWQDTADPSLFYYLPDEFRLARSTAAPRLPLLGVTVIDGATPQAEPTLSLEFMATPSVSSRRLDAARRELATRFRVLEDGRAVNAAGSPASPAELDASVARLRFEPLVPQRARLFLALPNAGAAAGLVERPDVAVDVRLGFYVAERFSIADFQAAYDALCGGSITLLRGKVAMEFGEDLSTDVPFVARFDRCNGDVLEANVQPAPDRTRWSCMVRNAIESPLTFSYAGVEARIDGLPARVSGAGSVALVPGATATFELETDAPVTADSPVFDLDLFDAVVRPDAKVLWDALIESDALPPHRREIAVETLPSLFQVRAGNPPREPIELLIVDFERGGSARLTAASPAATVIVRQPLAAVVLGNASNAEYRYRCRVVRASGETRGDWQTDAVDLLVPNLMGLT